MLTACMHFGINLDNVLLIQPRFRVQLCFFFPELEMEDGDVTVFCVGKDFAECLAG